MSRLTNQPARKVEESRQWVQFSDRWGMILFSVLLALIVWMVFGQTLGHPFVNLDDDVYVTDNARVQSGLSWKGAAWAFANLEAAFWHPLTWLSLMTDAQIHGMSASGFHLTNLLLHFFNALVLFALMRRLTGSPWRSATVAVLFAAHPLHVESVAWISQRKDLLSAFFGMLTLFFHARYAQSNLQSSRVRDYLLALFFFACALMSKTTVVTFPLLMLLLDYWPLKRWERISAAGRWGLVRKLFLEKAPFLVFALVAGLLTIYAEKKVGALGDFENLSISLRIANAALSSTRYLYQSVWPAQLAVFYPHLQSVPATLTWISLLLLALISVATFRARFRWPYLAVGWFWYLLVLLPVSGLIQVGAHAFADRYTYISLIGIFIVVTWGVADLAARWRQGVMASGVATVIIVIAFVFAARVQAAHWRDSVALWQRALASTRANSLAHLNLADALNAQGRWEEAIQQSEQTIRLKPDSALAYVNLGFALAGRGELDKAIQQYERALQIAPDLAQAHANLGIALTQSGKPEEGIRHCEAALRLQPENATLHYNLGLAVAAGGDLNLAMRHYERALQLQPNHASAHNNLASALATLGRLKDAIPHFERAVHLEPDHAEACYNLASALAAAGRPQAALPFFEKAMRLGVAGNNPALVEAVRAQLKAFGLTLPSSKF